jgi:uncharacterized protein YcfL
MSKLRISRSIPPLPPYTLMACTGNTSFVVVKGQKLVMDHSFKTESNEAGKLRKLVIDKQEFTCTDL